MYDFVLKNGKIIDGTGNPWFKGDVAVTSGKIAKIGRVDSSKANEVIDVSGKIVTPGWVDVHSHSDFTLLAYPKAQSKVMQGITTEVNGCCGMSAAPLKGAAREWAEHRAEGLDIDIDWSTWSEYLSKLERNGISINTANLIGHGTIRLCVVGWRKEVEPAELEEMKRLVEDSMKAGAFGLSSGLVYPPGFYATTEELIELCKVVHKYGGIYTSHVRGDRETQVESTKEIIEIGRKAGLPVNISHIEAKYPKHNPAWQRLKLSMMELARDEGIDITADTHQNENCVVYGIRALIPYPWRIWTDKKLREALRKAENREKLKEDMQMDPLRPEARGGPFGLTQQRAWHRVEIYDSKVYPGLRGKTIEECARKEGKEPEDFLIDLYLAEEDGYPALVIHYIESDIPTVASHPLVILPQTDGQAQDPSALPEMKVNLTPDWLNYFPRAIRLYALEHRYVPLEQLIRKMTSFAMQRYQIWDRGLLRPGYWADIVVFDKEHIRPGGSFYDPNHYPEGIDYVFVNGEIVVEKGSHTGALPGKALRFSP